MRCSHLLSKAANLCQSDVSLCRWLGAPDVLAVDVKRGEAALTTAVLYHAHTHRDEHKHT